MFEGIAAHDASNIGRGALPDAALQAYVGCAPPDMARHAFGLLKDVHATALLNAEALRKLVKKFDKRMAARRSTRARGGGGGRDEGGVVGGGGQPRRRGQQRRQRRRRGDGGGRT